MSTTIIDQPAGPMRRCGKVWDGLRSLGASGIGTFNPGASASDQNSLERALAQIIETANGHRAKGLPKGAPAYCVLRDKADAKIQAFARRWDVDIATIEAQAPALAICMTCAFRTNRYPLVSSCWLDCSAQSFSWCCLERHPVWFTRATTGCSA